MSAACARGLVSCRAGAATAAAAHVHRVRQRTTSERILALDDGLAPEDYYPSWLSPGVLTGAFPWEAALHTSLADFLEAYTLHDSNWILFALDPDAGSEATLAFRFDAFWTDGRVPHPGSMVSEWPVLLVRLRGLQAIRFDGYAEAGAEWAPRTIARASSRASTATNSISEFEDIVGGRVVVEHASRIELLCLDRAGAVVPLSV